MATLFAITGASGHVGNVVVKKLLDQRYKVRVLVYRDQHQYNKMINNPNVECVYGDIRDSKAVHTLCKGCDVVIHSAAHISITSLDKKLLWSVNIEGTNNVLDACKTHKIRKLVYVSSVEAIGKTHDGVHSESDGFSPNNTFIYYGYTKALATRNVIQAAKDGLVDASIICPVGITGPYDDRRSAFSVMVQRYLQRKLPLYPSKGGFCFVDVRDVADAIINAVSLGKNGEHYILSSEYVPIHRMMDILFECSGVVPPQFTVPLALMECAAMVIEPWCMLSKKTPIFTSGSVRILRSEFKVVSHNTERVLHVTPRSVTVSIRDQVAWHRNNIVSLH